MSSNAARMQANRLAVLTKYFGPPVSDPAAWPAEKRRAYGFAYRSSSRGFMEQGQADEGWTLLAQAVALYPDLLRRLDTFYEIACGDQPKGYRGQAHRLDIQRNGDEMLRRLAELFSQASASVRKLERVAYGNAYLALAMLSDQAGRWGLARAYLWRAVVAQPALLRDMSVIRRLFKLFAGKRIVRALQRLSSRATKHIALEGE